MNINFPILPFYISCISGEICKYLWFTVSICVGNPEVGAHARTKGSRKINKVKVFRLPTIGTFSNLGCFGFRNRVRRVVWRTWKSVNWNFLLKMKNKGISYRYQNGTNYKRIQRSYMVWNYYGNCKLTKCLDFDSPNFDFIGVSWRMIILTLHSPVANIQKQTKALSFVYCLLFHYTLRPAYFGSSNQIKCL